MKGGDNIKTSIRFFNDKRVRAIWDDDSYKWYFSVNDIIAAINNEDNYQKAANYWRWLKAKLVKENNQIVSVTNKLKLPSSDGKKYLTDTLDSDGVTMLAKLIPNPKAMLFLDWFTYSENSLDGQSKKKAYTLFESDLVSDFAIGTTKGLFQIHAYIFGGLFSFAGQVRNKDISKGGFKFAAAKFLPTTLKRIDKMPETSLDQIIEKYIEMNIAHPFLEGNGRAIRIWLDMMLKKNLKLCVDWSLITKKDYFEAMIASPNDPTPIKTLLSSALTDKINDRQMFMKGIDYSYYYEEEDM